jgi:hypothetical protein
MNDGGPIVGLKYSGKKAPFKFMNEHLLCKTMQWGRTGDTADVPLKDAQWMVKYSPSDFTIVYKNPVDAMDLPMEEPEDPVFTEAGIDGVDEEEVEKVDKLLDSVAQKRSPGRPKKDA